MNSYRYVAYYFGITDYGVAKIFANDAERLIVEQLQEAKFTKTDMNFTVVRKELLEFVYAEKRKLESTIRRLRVMKMDECKDYLHPTEEKG